MKKIILLIGIVSLILISGCNCPFNGNERQQVYEQKCIGKGMTLFDTGTVDCDSYRCLDEQGELHKYYIEWEKE